MNNWQKYHSEALNFLSGGNYAKNCTNISIQHGGESTLGQWGVAAAIYATIRCLFD